MDDDARVYVTTWSQMETNQHFPDSVRVDGIQFWAIRDDAPMPDGNSPAKHFGSHPIYVKFHDGRVIRTSELQTIGRIPDDSRQELPDNAELITRERYLRELAAPSIMQGEYHFYTAINRYEILDPSKFPEGYKSLGTTHAGGLGEAIQAYEAGGHHVRHADVALAPDGTAFYFDRNARHDAPITEYGAFRKFQVQSEQKHEPTPKPSLVNRLIAARLKGRDHGNEDALTQARAVRHSDPSRGQDHGQER